MATFFGIEDLNTQNVIDRDKVCFPLTPEGKLDLHNLVSPVKSEDVVFIKHSTTQCILQIKAVGVVKSDYPRAEKPGRCVTVDWVWKGEKILEHFDEARSLRNDLLYEEHDILVQKEISALLPEKYHLQPEW